MSHKIPRSNDGPRGDTRPGDTRPGDTRRGDTRRDDTPRGDSSGRAAKSPSGPTSTVTHISEAAHKGSTLLAAAQTERYLRELADAVRDGEVTGVVLAVCGPRRGVETFWQTLGSGRVTGVTLLGAAELVRAELSRHVQKNSI